MKEMRDGCNSYGGPYPLSKCDEKPMGGPKEEEADYAYRGYRGGRYQGNYYGRIFGNWRDRQPQDDNQNSQPHEDNPSNPPTLEKKLEEFEFKKTMREFVIRQITLSKTNSSISKPKSRKDKRITKLQFKTLKQSFDSPTNVPQDQLTYDPPVNPNAKTTIIHDDSEDEVDEAEKEVESSSSKQTKSSPPSLKAYKPKIPYPQRLRKEKMEERYAKFIDLIKEIRINIPLVDVLAGMPNYGKFLKDLVSNKDVIDEVIEEELDALLDDSKPFLNTSEKINETSHYEDYYLFKGRMDAS
ncbi:hypothetical protein Tco_0848508 [Tanacetum coccineum]